jgi:hypothetical protein
MISEIIGDFLEFYAIFSPKSSMLFFHRQYAVIETIYFDNETQYK